VAAASLGGYTLWQAPVWACERAADALDSDPSANPSARIEAAVKSCDAIARARPHDGRLQFLAGQTHQLNGGDSLAQAYWLRAAKLQDIDGMTAWGEHLWRSAASDRAARTQARPWLEAAAKAGKPASVTAMQDLANLLSEGDATPADRQAAQGWDAQARKLGGSK
jgi:TPR repeat protein